MKNRLLAAFTLVVLVVQLTGCMPAAPAAATKIPKFLIVGNSFARDSMSEFHNVLKAEGVEEYTIGYLYRGSCSLNMHAKYATSGTKGYSYRKITEDLADWNIPEENSNTMLEALQDEEWDYVFLQQVSGESANPDSYNKDLDFLMEYVKQNVSNPDVKLGWHLTWAYAQTLKNGIGAKSTYFLETFQGNPQLMYKGISDAVQSKILPNKEFSIVIPSGTAIENVRSGPVGDTLQRDDGYHLNARGRLVASYCWYAALTGKTIDSVKFVPDGLELSDSDKMLIVEAVNNACKNPYAITPSTLADGEKVS